MDYGILTNGRLWRLIPRQYSRQQRRFQTYLECDLAALLDAWGTQDFLIDDFMEFFLFFSPVAFEERDGRKPLIARAVEGSSEYRLGVGESLKRRAFKALELCIEGLLELHPHHASERMIVVSRRVQGRVDERVLPASADVPPGFRFADVSYRPGTVYLQTNKGERRASGSYYTPDHIVDHIVEHTLAPVVRRVGADLQREIDESDSRGDEAVVTRLQQEFPDRVLSLRVLDPAMGSGHFLIRACQYLGEEIATHPYSGDSSAAHADDDESAVSFWKRRVAECCLYGVDLNGLAVELAKLALWLETVAVNRPLTFLDHHLRVGNSLIGAKLSELGALPQEIALRASAVAQRVAEQLPVLLAPLAEIRQTPSDTVEQIKDKQRLYQGYEKRREPFRLLADLWTSAFVEQRLTDDRYQRAVTMVTEPKLFAQLARQRWFTEALALARRADVRPFHWELEFLEAFYNDAGRRADPGFDVIIGNPPYEVLSERESGHDLAALRAFIEHEPVYEPSRTGKNNLYKLFICRALELLADGGHFGFITPMAILGDKITAAIRHHLIQVANLTSVDGFPQKDNPAHRVFPEAKLSTAVFTLKRGAADGQPFRVRVHPGRVLEDDSPSYMARTADIPLYDPVNFTIISCSQADWDLATRIMRTGRLVRLRECAEFFQGEVNETNERARGNLVDDPDRGTLVTRGASICLYVPRPASQGRDLYLDVDRFLEGRGPDTKAFHHRHRRVCWQESSPQNNFRRVIAAIVEQGEFCNHTVNYVPDFSSSQPLELLLGVLNSKLIDWYFRLGSTNAHVSHYQAGNLPCPTFADDEPNLRELKNVAELLDAGLLNDAIKLLAPSVAEPPFSATAREAIVQAVKQIVAIETQRGAIRRVHRSALHPSAQPYQDFIDRLLYAMAGISDCEAAALERRLGEMM